MIKELFNTAIKNGKYVSIDVFKPGEGVRCGCVCPECGEKLMSNVTAKKRWQLKREFTNHFSHYDENSTCSGGTGETELHLFAKRVLEENDKLSVPSLSTRNNKLKYCKALSEQAILVEKFKQKRPDILLYDDSNHVICAIEIVVTNPVKEEKRNLYETSNLRCLAIDLSSYYEKDLEFNRKDIENEILVETKKKQWVWSADVEQSIAQKSSSDGSNNGLVLLLMSVLVLIFGKDILKFLKKFFRP
jgi:competence CoiA-like predicted nuclease